ncbi:MAG TPA: 50S ribosomal protein L35 [bacterium]|jgi:large subunit ribosomal protein L35|nr:50S ribosomal protein L35 [bacterium]
MAKVKTHQGTAKRIRVSARGKLMRGKQMAGHLKVGKRPSRLRRLRQRVTVEGADERRIGRLLPYRNK